MACTTHPATTTPAPPAMDRCECAEMSFAEIAGRMREEAIDLEELSRRTGCGRTCTACVSDLCAFLGRDRP